MENNQFDLWEVFLQPSNGASFQHAGSLRAADAEMALQNARDVYSRRSEARNIWVVPTEAIVSTAPSDQGPFFDPADDKVYRHPRFYSVPKGIRGI